MLVHVRNWCFSCLKINKFNITNAVNFTTHMHRILQLLPHNNICNHFITEKHKTYTFANVWNVEHPTSQTKLRTCMSRFNLNATNNCRNIITLHFLDHRIYIRLKIKPNSVRIRSLSWQIFVLPSTGFELTPLIHCSTNRLALCPAP